MLKKISWTVWKISLVWLICVYIHFLLYMVFNLDWYFINAAIPATAGIAISIVGYFAIVGFKNLCKMERSKTKGIALWIFWVNFFLTQILVLPFGIEIFNPDWAHPIGLIWLSFTTTLYCFYWYLSKWYE